MVGRGRSLHCHGNCWGQRRTCILRLLLLCGSGGGYRHRCRTPKGHRNAEAEPERRSRRSYHHTAGSSSYVEQSWAVGSRVRARTGQESRAEALAGIGNTHFATVDCLLDDGRTSTIFRILFSVGPSEISWRAREIAKLHWIGHVHVCTRSTKKEAAVDVLPLLHYPS